VAVFLRSLGDEVLELVLKDDVGIPADVDFEESGSLGLPRLIPILVKQSNLAFRTWIEGFHRAFCVDARKVLYELF
jgi:hypothetical protein